MDKNKNNEASNELMQLINKATQSFERGQFDKAIDLCRRAAESYKDGTDKHILAKIYFMWVHVLMRKEDYNPIMDIIEKAHNHMGKYLDLSFMYVMAAYGSGAWQATVDYVKKFAREHANTDPETEEYLKQSYNSLDEVYWLGSEAANKLLDLDLAIEFMTKSLELNPRHHLHRVELASLAAKHGKAIKAMEILDEGIEKYPREMSLKNAKGYLLGENREYEKAEEYIRNLLEQYPDDIDAINNLGVVYDSQGKYDQACEEFQRALDLDPDNPTARDNLKHLLDTIDNKPQTITAAMMVKNEEKFLPQCLDSVKDLVDEIIIVDTGSTDRTMEIAREYGAKIYEHPWQNDFSFHRNQTIEYSTSDWVLIIDADEELDPSEHRTIRQAIKRRDIEAISFVVYNKIQMGRVGFLNSHRMFRNGRGYKYHGIVHNQLDIAGKTLMSQFKVIHHGYGLSDEQMEKKGRRSEALLLKQLEENPELTFPHFNLAQIYRGLGEPKKSLEHAKIVIEKTPLDDLDHRHVRLMAMDQVGCAYIGMEDFENAEKIFFETLEIRDDYMDPLFNLGFMYMRQKRYNEAEKVFNRYLKAKAEYSPEREWMGLILNNLNSEFAVYYALGFIHYLRNEKDEAFALFKKSNELTEDFEYLHHLLTRCYRERGNIEKILEHSAKAVEFGHEDAEIRILEGEAYLNQDNPDEARRCFERALELEPDNHNAMIGIIGADSLDKPSEEILKTINEFLEKSPNSAQGLSSKGDVLFDMGDYSNARKTYQDVTKNSPDDVRVLNNLGNCFLKEKNFASAEVYYLMALQRNNNFLPGYRNLAVSLINQGRMDDASEYLEYYIKGNPSDKEIHATLGDIYYNSKNYQKAIGHFEQLVMAYPSNMDAIIRLSDCYFNLGKLQAAVAGYQGVLVIQPDNEVAKQRLSQLKDFLEPVESQ